MAKKNKNTGPNFEVRIFQDFTGRDPSRAAGANELFQIDIYYDGDFRRDSAASRIDLDKIGVRARLRDDTGHRIKGHMPTPVVTCIDDHLEPGIKLPFDVGFIPCKEAARTTQNIRYASKTAQSIRDQLQNIIKNRATQPEAQPDVESKAASRPDDPAPGDLIDATFTSVWDGGASRITTPCRIDRKTREIVEIEMDPGSGDGLDTLDEEFVTVNGIKYPAVREPEAQPGDFWYR